MTDHVTGDQVKRVTVEEAWADLLECIRTDPYNERGERGDLRNRVEAAVREDERERIESEEDDPCVVCGQTLNTHYCAFHPDPEHGIATCPENHAFQAEGLQP